VSGKTTPFFIHLLRFLAFSDFSAYRRHHAVSTSYFGEGIELNMGILAPFKFQLTVSRKPLVVVGW
jgi:hypothetical protein